MLDLKEYAEKRGITVPENPDGLSARLRMSGMVLLVLGLSIERVFDICLDVLVENDGVFDGTQELVLVAVLKLDGEKK